MWKKPSEHERRVWLKLHYSGVLYNVGKGYARGCQLSGIRPFFPKRIRGPYDRGRCSEQAPALLLRGIEQFNRREFFAQHETLEDLWRGEPGDVRYLYQGILLVGVGFLHLERGNYRGALSKLEAGLEKLQWFLPNCQGVDVSRLVQETGRCLGRLRELGPERIVEFDSGTIPRVHWTIATTGT